MTKLKWRREPRIVGGWTTADHRYLVCLDGGRWHLRVFGDGVIEYHADFASKREAMARAEEMG